jgi:hypothetical protein
VALGLDASRILVVPANITSPTDLLRIRDEVVNGTWACDHWPAD